MRIRFHNPRKTLIMLGAACLLCYGCGRKQKIEERAEDLNAKRMLQGIWLNDEDGSVVFRVKGDSVFYPDATSMPVVVRVYTDSIAFVGANTVTYPILKQDEHLFVFKNNNDDVVKLVKSEEPTDAYAFEPQSVVTFNQRQLIKSDTVAVLGQDGYHSYIQINPTTYKVVKTQYNDEGVEVDNIYYDNIIHVSSFKGYAKVYSKDFYNHDFSRFVPERFLKQSILNEILFQKIDNAGLHYKAILGIPDSPVSYLIEMVVSFKGELSMQIKNS